MLADVARTQPSLSRTTLMAVPKFRKRNSVSQLSVPAPKIDVNGEIFPCMTTSVKS
jgi:hypothetical protein